MVSTGTFQMTVGRLRHDGAGRRSTSRGLRPGLLRAVVGGRATLGGTVQQPRIDLALSTPDVTLDQRRFGPSRSRREPRPRRSRAWRSTAKDLGATLAGTVDLEGARVFNLTARIDSPDSPLAVDTQRRRARAWRDDPRGARHRAAHAAVHRDARCHDSEARRRRRWHRPHWPPGTTTVALQDEAHAATPTPLLPLEVQAGSRLSYRPDLLTLSDVVVTSGNTKVTANGIFGSPDDVLRIDSNGRLEDLRALLLALSPPGVENLVFEGPARVNAVASGTFDRPTLKGSLEVDGARLGDGIRPPFEVGVGPRRPRRRADSPRPGRGPVAGRAHGPVRVWCRRGSSACPDRRRPARRRRSQGTSTR